MKQFIEALESRKLLSATLPVAVLGDVMKLVVDAHATKVDFQQHVPAFRADMQALGKDLHGLPDSGSNHSLLGKLRGDEGHALAKIRADLGSLFNVGGASVRRALADGMRVFLHPNDAMAKAKLSADVTALQAAATAMFMKLGTDVMASGSAITADLSALTAANPTDTTLAKDVQTTETDGGKLVTAVSSDLQAVNADFTKLFTDLAAIA